MNYRLQRIASGFLLSALSALCLWLFSVTAVAESTNNGVQEKLDQIRNVYNTGSYFTKTGTKCTSSNHNVINGIWCDGCKLAVIPSRGGLPAGKTLGIDADTCGGFAKYVYYCLYGHNCTSSEKKSTPVFGDLVFVETNSTNAYQKGHWFIYLSEDSNYYYVYDANGYNNSSGNKVTYNNTYPKNIVVRKTVYHASNYDSINNSSSVTYASLSCVAYYLKNNSTGTYMNADGTDSKANVSVATFSGKEAQQFVLSGTDQSYALTPKVNSTLRVNPFADTLSNGTNVNLYPASKEIGTDMHWRFEAVSGGYKIHNTKFPTFVLALSGTNVIVTTAGNSADQVWTLVPVNCTHSYGGWQKKDDSTHTRTCTICGNVDVSSHTWNSGTVTKAATCAATGVKTFTCTGCSASKTESISKTSNHSYGSWTRKSDDLHARKCTVCGKEETAAHSAGGNWQYDGSTHYQVCSVCNGRIKAAAHTPGAAATETTAQVCTTCGYVIQPAKGHTHQWGTTWKQNLDGHWHECSGCSEQKDYAKHTSGGLATVDHPETCSVCGYVMAPALPIPETEPESIDESVPESTIDSSLETSSEEETEKSHESSSESETKSSSKETEAPAETKTTTGKNPENRERISTYVPWIIGGASVVVICGTIIALVLLLRKRK